MTRPDPNDSNSSTRVDRDAASGTGTGTGATSRMSGTTGQGDTRDTHDDKQHDKHDKGDKHGKHDAGTAGAAGAGAAAGEERYEERVKPATYKSAKTSAGATFALVFGLAALFCALTGILAPFAVLFGIIGIILGVAGLKMVKRPGVTGKGVAIGGLVTAILGLLLGGAVLAGVAVYVNDQGLDQLEQRFDDARSSLETAAN